MALIRDLFFLDYDRTHFASPEVQKRHFREYASRHGYASWLTLGWKVLNWHWPKSITCHCSFILVRRMQIL